MKKRTLGMVIALVAAFSLLTVTAFASAPTYEGYEAFKELAKNHEDQEIEHENATVKGSLKVIDNGETVLDLVTTLKVEGEEVGSGSVTLTANGVSKELNVFAQDEKVYIFDELEQTYYVADKDAMEASDVEYDYEDYEEFERGTRHEEMTSAQEELMDFIMGDLKDDFEVDHNADGSQTITFELTKEEIPMLLNLAVSAADGHDRRADEYDEYSPDATLLAKYPILNDFVGMENNTPEITDNVELEYMKVTVTTDDENFGKVAFDFIVSGDDEVGEAHTIQVQGEFEVSEIGTTSADTPELDGKELIEIDPADFEELQDDEYSHRGPKGRR